MKTKREIKRISDVNTKKWIAREQSENREEKTSDYVMIEKSQVKKLKEFIENDYTTGVFGVFGQASDSITEEVIKSIENIELIGSCTENKDITSFIQNISRQFSRFMEKHIEDKSLLKYLKNRFDRNIFETLFYFYRDDYKTARNLAYNINEIVEEIEKNMYGQIYSIREGSSRFVLVINSKVSSETVLDILSNIDPNLKILVIVTYPDSKETIISHYKTNKLRDQFESIFRFWCCIELNN